MLPTVGSSQRKKEPNLPEVQRRITSCTETGGQSADRRERPYAGTGKPNSIDADSWSQMSTRSREIYVQTERELSLREERRREHPERDPADPAPGRKLLIEFACEPDSRLSAVMMSVEAMQFAFMLAHLTSPTPKTLVGLLRSSRIILGVTSGRQFRADRGALGSMSTFQSTVPSLHHT